MALCATWRFPGGALCHVALPGWRFPGLPMWRFLSRKRHIGGKLTSDEDREVGKVRLGVFLAYIKAVGPLTGTMIITGIVLYQFTRVGASWWLATWANDTVADETGGRSAFYYLGIYALLCGAQVATVSPDRLSPSHFLILS